MLESPKVAELCLLSEYEEKPTSWRLSERDAELATKLEKRFKIDELKDGVRIKANSWVGHVTFDAFDLVIRPKFAQLDASPLATLLAYAFNWQNLEIAGHQISSEAYFAEILVHGLLEEAHSIQRRGPFQQYQKERRDLSVLRGKIDMTTWLRRGGIPSESMPCVFYRRSLDNILNQTLCAGLRRGAALAKTPELKSKCHFLADTFALSVTERMLDHRMLADAQRSLNRLNAHYKNAIQIIQLLYDGSGGFTHGEPRAERIPGFFFDMNMLFERVIAKFLNKNLPDQYKVTGQGSAAIYSDDTDGTQSSRPDILITKTTGETLVLDTKYKDLDEYGVQPADCYQLSVYALAYSKYNDSQHYCSTILYPASSTTQDEQPKARTITLHRHDDRKAELCTIRLQPINMLKLVEHVESENAEQKKQFALGLIEP